MFKALEIYIEVINGIDNAMNEGVTAASDYLQVDTKTVLDQDVDWSLDGKRMELYLQ